MPVHSLRMIHWRTVLTVMWLSMVLLAALFFCREKGEMGVKLFADASLSLVLLAVAVATKSGLQHAVGGGGIKGAIGALLGTAAPQPAPETPKP